MVAMELKDDEYSDAVSTSGEHRFWWLHVVPAVRKRDKGMCRCCSSTKNLHTHHLSYKQDISINELVTLCISCHYLCHRGSENASKENLKKLIKLKKNGWVMGKDNLAIKSRA